jgi:hypothetical protein
MSRFAQHTLGFVWRDSEADPAFNRLQSGEIDADFLRRSVQILVCLGQGGRVGKAHRQAGRQHQGRQRHWKTALPLASASALGDRDNRGVS